MADCQGGSQLLGSWGEDNPRILVTSLLAHTHPAQCFYEQFYCAREDIDFRMKEYKMDSFSKCFSSNLFDTNALRLMLSTFAVVMMETLRQSLQTSELQRT